MSQPYYPAYRADNDLPCVGGPNMTIVQDCDTIDDAEVLAGWYNMNAICPVEEVMG